MVVVAKVCVTLARVMVVQVVMMSCRCRFDAKEAKAGIRTVIIYSKLNRPKSNVKQIKFWGLRRSLFLKKCDISSSKGNQSGSYQWNVSTRTYLSIFMNCQEMPFNYRLFCTVLHSMLWCLLDDCNLQGLAKFGNIPKRVRGTSSTICHSAHCMNVRRSENRWELLRKCHYPSSVN
jgi:hypothetical protein